MSVDELAALDARHVWHPFTQAATADPPIVIARGEGSRLFDHAGRAYLDLVSSWWVTLHGHARPEIVHAIARQAERLEQAMFAGFTHEPAIRLARRLVERLPPGLTRVFFSDDGSTSVEVALKLALQYWRNRGTARRRILAFAGGYHGDTFGAMAAGASSGFYAPFRDLLIAVDFVPFPATWIGDDAVVEKEAASLAAIDAWIDRHGADAACAILEPLVQGAAGMRMCRPEFLRQAASRIQGAGALLILDEVMTGFGRTGADFATIKAGLAPDMVCLAKGLTGGFLPLAVTVLREEIHAAFLGERFERAFAHGHSYTANPLGCAAALASLDLLATAQTQRCIAAIEARHRAGLAGLASLSGFSRLRLCGTIAAMTVSPTAEYGDQTGARLAAFFLGCGLIVRPLAGELYFLPPYCISDEEIDRAYAVAAEWAGVRS